MQRAVTTRQDDNVDPKAERLLDAAYEVFMASGFTKSSMADIAAAAGVSRPTLYRTFANKDDVFLGVVERLHTQTQSANRSAANDQATLTEQLTAAATAKLSAHIAVARSSPHGVDLLDVNQRIGGRLAEIADSEFHRFVTTLLDGDDIDLKAHGLTARRAAAVVMAVIGGWQQRISLGGHQPAARWRRDLETALAVIVRGLR